MGNCIHKSHELQKQRWVMGVGTVELSPALMAVLISVLMVLLYLPSQGRQGYLEWLNSFYCNAGPCQTWRVSPM